MKKHTIIPALISLGLIFFAGCDNPLSGPNYIQPIFFLPGHGTVLVSLAGANVLPSLDARTMLPQNPEFTRYELEFFTDSTGSTLSGEPYSFTNSNIQLQLPEGIYYIRANGYDGEVLAAQSDIEEVPVFANLLASVEFRLRPYMDDDASGVLSFSLSWDGLSRMPARAELFIERFITDAWEPLDLSLIPQSLSRTGPGTILLIDKAAAFVNLNGSLPLPPGEYGLTMTVTMDTGGAPVSRYDVAHVYSNLTTPASFHYGGGDLLLSNISPDSGAAFITGFTFDETPNATTVIGSEPGADGTRLIMIMVPPGKNLAALTPKVTCAPGSSIVAPLMPDGTTNYTQGEIDFTNPTIWTAQAKNGAVQRYTVVVSNAPVDASNKKITYFFFEGYANYPGIIDQDAETITVQLPFGTTITSLTPIISIIGYDVVKDGGGAIGSDNFTLSKFFDVYATSGHTDSAKTYMVTVTVGQSGVKVITQFAIDGYPGVSAVITPDAGGGQGAITATLPYGVSLANLTPLILYNGRTLEPASGAVQNFSAPVYYTVTASDNTKKTYKVTLSNEAANDDTGIFDFVITNVPAAKVVIGQKPRQDGKIPIVIQVPYGTNEENLITAITLRSSTSTISPSSGIPVPFQDMGNPQEAVYTVTSQDGKKQDYVALVSEGGQYLYVNGVTGANGPDYYQGMSEDRPYKTLAYAASRAAGKAGIDHIFVSGELNALNQAGGGDSSSVIAIAGTGSKKITVTGMGAGATFRGTSGQRVLSVTGSADLVFENITVTGGNVTGNGGGVYIGGNTTGVYSKVKFSGGGITGNTASGSGGGVYIEGSGAVDANSASEFTLENASVSGNTALGTSTQSNDTNTGAPIALTGLAGGGGVCVSGDALFWMSSGTIANNTAGEVLSGSNVRGGSGGGVLVRSTLFDTGYTGIPANLGFIMSGGTISNNKSYGAASPHGGGGVYVASGEFEMLGGSIVLNYSKRQGGGVFVHSGAVFNASGYSSITGNDGVGSSKGLCSRGVTEMTKNAQADTVYVWNPLAADAEPLAGAGADYNKFTIAENARIGGVVLAHSAEGRNLINLANTISGAGQIANIDLEGHLTNFAFKDTDINDWLNKKIMEGAAATLNLNIRRFSLGTFVGGTTLSLSPYKLSDTIDANIGKLVKK
jgi:hypothetical protein